MNLQLMELYLLDLAFELLHPEATAATNIPDMTIAIHFLRSILESPSV